MIHITAVDTLELTTILWSSTSNGQRAGEVGIAITGWTGLRAQTDP